MVIGGINQIDRNRCIEAWIRNRGLHFSFFENTKVKKCSILFLFKHTLSGDQISKTILHYDDQEICNLFKFKKKFKGLHALIPHYFQEKNEILDINSVSYLNKAKVKEKQFRIIANPKLIKANSDQKFIHDRYKQLEYYIPRKTLIEKKVTKKSSKTVKKRTKNSRKIKQSKNLEFGNMNIYGKNHINFFLYYQDIFQNNKKKSKLSTTNIQ